MIIRTSGGRPEDCRTPTDSAQIGQVYLIISGAELPLITLSIAVKTTTTATTMISLPLVPRFISLSNGDGWKKRYKALILERINGDITVLGIIVKFVLY